MKSFKTFNEMASAKQIKSVDLLNSNSYKEAMAKVLTMGAKGFEQNKLGEGYFSAVFGDVGPMVIKLSDSGTDGTYYYLQLAKEKWITNRCYPRVAAIKPFDQGYGYIAIMEKLDFSLAATTYAWKIDDFQEQLFEKFPEADAPKKYNSERWFRHIGLLANEHYCDGYEDNEYYKIFQNLMPEMDRVFMDLFKNFSETSSIACESLDIHHGNVANRKGKDPVLVDPIGNAYGSTYNYNGYTGNDEF